MKRSVIICGGMMVVGLLAAQGWAAQQCPPDSVPVGNFCADTYEASVWKIPAGKKALLKQVKNGTATRAALTAGGATQRGLGSSGDYPCDDNGNDCNTIYAVSLAGVKPSLLITWFQAQQACGNAGKRLLRNGEWQMAAAGTPDPGTDNGSTDCNTTGDGVPGNGSGNTGSRSDCVSRWGAFDMVGNAAEWVEDWGAAATTCTTALFSGDANCLAGAGTTYGPAALVRGGSFEDEGGAEEAGVFAVSGFIPPSIPSVDIGFRCGR